MSLSQKIRIHSASSAREGHCVSVDKKPPGVRLREGPNTTKVWSNCSEPRSCTSLAGILHRTTPQASSLYLMRTRVASLEQAPLQSTDWRLLCDTCWCLWHLLNPWSLPCQAQAQQISFLPPHPPHSVIIPTNILLKEKEVCMIF